MNIIELKQDNVHYLSRFMANEFPSTFRYFNNKTAEQVTKYHHTTVLAIDDDVPVGYAHIDYDIANGSYWFGICVLPSHQLKGIGSLLIKNILEKFQHSTMEVLMLSVDKDNKIAIHLYEKYGFTILRSNDTVYFMSIKRQNVLYLPVSFGEAIDKLTILDIKMDKILDWRRNDVENEYRALHSRLEHLIPTIEFYYAALKQINLQIWNDQDTFRYSSDHNLKNVLCKQIIEDNDARFRIKNVINKLLYSFLKEQKGYNQVTYHIHCDTSIDIVILHSIIRYQSIFNDKIVVHCCSELYDLFRDKYSGDSIIDIIHDTSSQVSTVETLFADIKNMFFFEFIQRMITNRLI